MHLKVLQLTPVTLKFIVGRYVCTYVIMYTFCTMLHTHVCTHIGASMHKSTPCIHTQAHLMHVMHIMLCMIFQTMYGTAQFKLDRTHVQQGHDTTRFSFHTCKPAYARKIGDVKPTMQSSCVCTRRVHDARIHVRNAHAKFGLHVHANCKPRTVE